MYFDVREATADDQSEIDALIAEMIPGCDVAARRRWLYETNPGGTALTWLAIARSGSAESIARSGSAGPRSTPEGSAESSARSGSAGPRSTPEGSAESIDWASGEVAGCTSLFPWRMSLDGETVRGALGGDGFVRPKFRRRGLGGLLHDASRVAMPRHRLGCMYGAPGAMNLTPLKHGGSREVGHVVRWVRPLRVGPLALPTLARARLEPMRDLDERVDALWRTVQPELRLACVRDAAFYTWRFRESPAQRQPTYVILDGDTPIGACGLEQMDARATLRIVDLLAPRETWHVCLRAIAAFGVESNKAASVEIVLFALDGRDRKMWKSGFVERGGKPFLCMIPTDGDRRFVDPGRWFYTNADSDLDDHR